MAIDKLVPQYLNSDTDQKLVKSVEMTDNLNVRTSSDEEGSSGVLKNIKGTNPVGPKTPAHDFPAGSNRVVGSVTNEKSKEVIFFLWNSNANHGIYRLETNIDKYVKVYEDSVLAFQKFGHVDCDYTINEEEETLVYFTDNVNPPMKLNITRVISGGYPSTLTSGTDKEKLSNLTIAKTPPLKAPTYSLVNNSSLGYNNIVEKVFQFSYKYLYEDGEHSSLSPYSSIAFADNLMKDYFITESQKEFFNQIDVYLYNTNSDVKEIILYARENTGQTFYEINRIQNTSGTGLVTVPFTNNRLGKPLSKEDVLKSYDNVPQKAKALSVSNNRLFLGNYTEGYPNTNVNTEIITNYKPKPVSYDIDVTMIYGNTSLQDLSIPVIQVDVSSLNAIIPGKSVINLNFIVQIDTINIGGSGYGDEDIILEDGELQIVYKTEDDSTSIETNRLAAKELRGESFLTNYWQLYLSTTYPILYQSTLNPALSFDTEGLYIRESIPVSLSTSKADIITLISNRLAAKTYDCFLNPTDDSRRLCIVKHQANNLYSEKAAFQGTATFNLEQESITGDLLKMELKMKHIDIEPYEFYKNGSKPTEIINTNRIRLEAYSQTTREITPYIWKAEIQQGGSGVYEDLSGYRSFKSGASHKLGIVYLDDRGRASGVQEVGDSYVESLNKRTNLLKGASSMVMKVTHNAPSWASKWMPVYTGSGSVELKFMYSVLGAFIPRNNLNQNTSLQSKNNIYISVNSIFGENGFNKSFGADINYQFEKGDRLRVIDHSNGQKYTGEFKIVGFKRLTQEEDSNPIFDNINENAKSVTSGDFLIIEDNGDFPFSYSAVINEASKWFNQCIVEVYRNKKELENDDYVYYEIGKTYDVNSGAHASDRSVSSLSATINLSTTTIFSSDRFFKGDSLLSGSSTITIKDVWFENGSYYAIYEDLNTPQLSSGSYSFTVVGSVPTIEINQGDVYFRPRLLFCSAGQIDQVSYRKAGSMSATVNWIEDYSVSDFFSSNQTSKGKPYAYIPEAKTTRRLSSITYSDPYVIDSEKLSLSSFNLSNANWKDMDLEYGQIDKIISRGDSLTVLQDSKASTVPTGRNLIAYANGKESLTTSTDVLGKESYYAGDFGTSGNPESVIERFGVVYYADMNSRKIIRLSADGITPISHKGMGTLFEDVFEDLSNNVSTPKIVGGFDPDNNEYLVTVEDLSQSFINIGNSDPELEATSYEVELNENGLYEPTQVYTSTAVIWNNINFDWELICAEWEDLGNGILNIESGEILLDSSLIGSTSTVIILITNTSSSFVAVGQIDLSTGIIILPSTTCPGQSITTDFGGSESQGLTIAYKHKEGFWGSKYSFKPTNYANIGNKMYSFFDTDSGLSWVHNKNETRNNFYGSQYNSMFEVSSNYNPSMIKSYEAIGIEGGGTWTSEINTESQNTSIEFFEQKEGHQYGMVRRNIINSKSNKIFLGTISSVSGNTISFSTPINRIPFNIGDSLKTVVGGVVTDNNSTIVSSNERKSLVCSSPVFSVGDNVMIEQSAYVNGDPIRDVFAKIKMISTDTEPYEVHAVSVSYTRSRLHNDRVN